MKVISRIIRRDNDRLSLLERWLFGQPRDRCRVYYVLGVVAFILTFVGFVFAISGRSLWMAGACVVLLFLTGTFSLRVNDRIGTYSSVQEWENDCHSDLVESDKVWTGEVYVNKDDIPINKETP